MSYEEFKQAKPKTSFDNRALGERLADFGFKGIDFGFSNEINQMLTIAMPVFILIGLYLWVVRKNKVGGMIFILAAPFLVMLMHALAGTIVAIFVIIIAIWGLVQPEGEILSFISLTGGIIWLILL